MRSEFMQEKYNYEPKSCLQDLYRCPVVCGTTALAAIVNVSLICGSPVLGALSGYTHSSLSSAIFYASNTDYRSLTLPQSLRIYHQLILLSLNCLL